MTSRGPFQPKTFYDSMILSFTAKFKLTAAKIHNLLGPNCSVLTIINFSSPKQVGKGTSVHGQGQPQSFAWFLELSRFEAMGWDALGRVVWFSWHKQPLGWLEQRNVLKLRKEVTQWD